MTISDLAQLGVLAVSAFAIVMSLRGLRDQLWLQTFSEYTRRYLEVLDAMPASATLAEGQGGAYESNAADRQAMLMTMRRYVNLCSEEYYLHSRRRIDKSTWRVWTDGMHRTMSLPAFREAWRTVGAEYEYFQDFHAFMTRLVQASEPRTPTPPMTDR